MPAAYLGIDIGTSGLRGSCIDDDEQELARYHISFSSQATSPGKNEQDPMPWRNLLDQLIVELGRQLQDLDQPHQITSIAIDGTSSTLIACDKNGEPLYPALMYNDQQGRTMAERISHYAPADSAVHGASSSLAKAFFLLDNVPETALLCHQADWLAATLTGQYGISDENNCLKLGYDSINRCWPEWLNRNSEDMTLEPSLLPEVLTPGTPMAPVLPSLIDRYKLAKNCIVAAGTTDSNAAVLATGANTIGDAITSLGSTLVIKVFSEHPIFDARYGIYSHRLNDHWLVGGASNTGGSVLLQHFSQTQLDEMTPHLTPEHATGLDYYPLPGIGERFPVNDSNKQNRTDPRPESDVAFFQALLEGMARIEADAYEKLSELGTGKPNRIFTAGGGGKNPAWKVIREQTTGLPVVDAQHSDACYGSALLAKRAITHREIATSHQQ